MNTYLPQFRLCFLPLLFLSLSTSAQLPDGSMAPDWTATDIFGTTWNMYDELEAGKAVILDFGATWCSPCWYVHTNGSLETLYDQYGPTGTDELQIFFLESDPNTTDDALFGIGSNTLGDWTANADYPIINGGETVYWDYENSYYGTMYLVCPNGQTKLLPQYACSTEIEDLMLNHCGHCADPTACNYSGEIENTPCIYPGQTCSADSIGFAPGMVGNECTCEIEGCEIPGACNFNGEPGLNCDFYSCQPETYDSTETFGEYAPGQISNQSGSWMRWPQGSGFVSAALVSDFGTNQYLVARDNSPDGGWGSPSNIFRSFDVDIEGEEVLQVTLNVHGSSCKTWTYRLWGADWGETWGEGISELVVHYDGGHRIEVSTPSGFSNAIRTESSEVDIKHVVDGGSMTIETWVDGTLIARTPMASPFSGIQFNPQREGDEEAYMLIDQIDWSVGTSLFVPGCTDQDACNYDVNATDDDGSCFLIGDTCDDGDANTLFDTVDENCVCAGAPIIYGCMNAEACNFDQAANTEDGSCLFPGTPCDDGIESTIGDILDADCLCAGQPIVLGCMDSLACNYVSEANTDDAGCAYPGETCDDGNDATIFDTITSDCNCIGVPMLEGCTDLEACNFNELANVSDSSCTYPGTPCDDGLTSTSNDAIQGDCSCLGEACHDSTACNFMDLSGLSNPALCYFLTPIQLSGDTLVEPGSEVIYFLASSSDGDYEWEVTGGIISASTDTSITVAWNASDTLLTVCVFEVNGPCEGETECLEISIAAPNGVHSLETQAELRLVYDGDHLRLNTFPVQMMTSLMAHDATGRVVEFQTTPSHAYSMHWQQWPDGIYFLRVQLESGQLLKSALPLIR